MVKCKDGREFSFDGYLYNNISILKKLVNEKDWDGVILIDGIEGGGKSVMAMQIAYACDETITLDRVCFSAGEFRNAVLNAGKGQAVVYDEAYGALSARQAMTLINKVVIDMLTEIRQKNLFLIIVLPSFFDLDRIVSLWRSRCLIHIYTGDNFERGYFVFFSRDKKSKLYTYGRKFYNYNAIKADFYGRFHNFYVLNEQDYRDKKLKNLRATAVDSRVKNKQYFQRNMLLKFIAEKDNYSQDALSGIFSCLPEEERLTRTAICEGIKDLNQHLKELGISKSFKEVDTAKQ